MAEPRIRNRKTVKSTCLYCGNEFLALYDNIVSGYGKYCCHEHYGLSMKGISLPRLSRKGISPWNKGLIGFMSGEKNVFWMGGLWSSLRSDYKKVHRWIVKELGKPDTCEMCGNSKLSGLKIQWSNKSGEYKFEVGDWQRLCRKCHTKYDLEKFNGGKQYGFAE